MNWNDIHSWLDRFHAEVVEQRKVIRGFIYMGCHLETWEKNEIWVVLEPGARGDTDEARSADMIRSILHDGNRVLEAPIPFERFERIVRGEDTIKDDEWIWSDER